MGLRSLLIGTALKVGYHDWPHWLLVDLGLPFARIGSTATGAGFSIAMDDYAAAETATNHLLDLGHRRIGFISGSPEYALSGARLQWYRAAMAGRGLPDDADLVGHGGFIFASGEAAMKTWGGVSSRVTHPPRSRGRGVLRAPISRCRRTSLMPGAYAD